MHTYTGNYIENGALEMFGAGALYSRNTTTHYALFTKWTFPLIEAGGLSAHTTQGISHRPVSAPIPNAGVASSDLLVRMLTSPGQASTPD